RSRPGIREGTLRAEGRTAGSGGTMSSHDVDGTEIEILNSDGAPSENAKRHVLVVEDRHTVASVVKYFLELEGLEVRLAANGRIGLGIALEERPDIIVSDMYMPDMNGLEMVRTIRANPELADVRILMLTSETSVDCEAEMLAAGADDYIVKPIEPRRLAARVKALLGRSRSRAA